MPRISRRRSGNTTEFLPERAGGELVGCYISIEWPLQNRYYGARILRYIEEKGKHIILYEYEEDFAAEEVDLNNHSRKWRRETDPFLELHSQTTPHALVGRIVTIDAHAEDTTEEARDKLACVVAVIHPQMQEIRGYGGRLTCAAAKPLLHRVIWIFGLDLDDVDFALHSYTINH